MDKDNSNLVPQSERTKDEQREIARQGSISREQFIKDREESKQKLINEKKWDYFVEKYPMSERRTQS